MDGKINGEKRWAAKRKRKDGIRIPEMIDGAVESAGVEFNQAECCMGEVGGTNMVFRAMTGNTRLQIRCAAGR